MSLGAALVIGMTRGLAHALEADHVAAVATFVSEDRSVGRAARSALLWGAGHAAAIVGLGGALIALGVELPPHLAKVFDAGVVLALVGLGLAALRSASAAPSPPVQAGWLRFGVGLVHGLSGTAALTVFLALHVRERAAAVGFLGVFGLSTLAAMGAVSALLGWSLAGASARLPRLARALRAASGVASLATAALVASAL